MARNDQFLSIFPVDVVAFRLLVGTVVPSPVHPFVKLDAAPGQGVKDVLLRPFHLPFLVGVFDPEDHFPVVLPCEKVIVQSCAHAADVQRPRG